MSKPKKSAFLKPQDESSLWKVDRPDVDDNNSTSFVYNRLFSLPITEQRKRLPIHKYKMHILYLLEQHQVLVLVGETGCGKSTQIPQYLLEAGWCNKEAKVCVVEPRRFCATTLAQRVAEEQFCELGSVVGYAIRFDDCTSSSTKVKYVTDGILLQEIMADPLLRQYAVIILDEVHERNVSTDILLGLLKKILQKRKRLKLVVMSATVDANSIKNFFEFKGNETNAKESAVVLNVRGRQHPVLIHYLNEPVPDYVMGVVNCVRSIHEHEPEGDVLAFLTGLEEVHHVVAQLKEHNMEKLNKNFQPLVLPMHGSLPYSEQVRVFQSTPAGTRKIVIATNIAETSITIYGIVYVVDSGFVKMKWYNSKTFTDSLIITPISQASANQRAGRAGRVKPGKVYRLYSEKEYGKLSECSPPEMIRTDLSSAVLQLKALGIDNVFRFTFPSPPPAEHLLLAFELLYALNAVNDEGKLTKPVGSTMAEFPLPPLHAKTLLSSVEFECTDEITTILAMIQVDNVFIKPFSGKNAIRARVEKRKFEVQEGDLVTFLNVFNGFEKNAKNARSWCSKYFISYKVMKRVLEIKSQMLKLLGRFGIPKSSCNGNTEKIRRCLTSGFFTNAAYLHYSGAYKSVRGDEDLYIHPTSVLYTLEQPQWYL